MTQGYFHRVQKETPTRFWVNNPTVTEAAAAIKAGADYCTTNPTYASKMLVHPEMEERGKGKLKDVLAKEGDDSLAAAAIQREMVKLIMPPFLDIYRKSEGTRGWVSIQGDPEKEDDPAEILREAEKGLKTGKNYIAKIPVTRSGLTAIETLARERVPIIATEVMSLSQAIAACETYTNAISNIGNPSPVYVTHITGIFDQQLGEWKEKSGAAISDDILGYAGFLAGRKQYNIIKERKYPVVMLGGGARGLHHFTDFVGADMHVTINWKGTADKLLELDLPVENRIGRKVSESITEELLEKIPVFKAAWDQDCIELDDFSEFPPVVLFRSMFLDGWKKLVAIVKEERNG